MCIHYVVFGSAQSRSLWPATPRRNGEQIYTLTPALPARRCEPGSSACRRRLFNFVHYTILCVLRSSFFIGANEFIQEDSMAPFVAVWTRRFLRCMNRAGRCSYLRSQSYFIIMCACRILFQFIYAGKNQELFSFGCWICGFMFRI